MSMLDVVGLVYKVDTVIGEELEKLGEAEGCPRMNCEPDDDFRQRVKGAVQLRLGLLPVGTYVRKKRGYMYEGVIVSSFLTLERQRRYVVEHSVSIGMLHIFSPDQLERVV